MKESFDFKVKTERAQNRWKRVGYPRFLKAKPARIRESFCIISDGFFLFSFLIIPIIRKHGLVTQKNSIMQGPRDSEELQ